MPAVEGAANVSLLVPLVLVAEINVPAPPCNTTSPAVPLPAPMVVASVPVVLIVVVPVMPVVPKMVLVEPLLPMPSVVVEAVAKLTVPAPLVLSVKVPVPLARTVRPVLLVLALMTGLVPLNVSAVELKVLVLIVLDVVTAPVIVTPPLPPCNVVSEVPVAEPRVVLWSVALLAKPQPAPAITPQTTCTLEPMPLVPIVMALPRPWLRVRLWPPWMSVLVLAPVLPRVIAVEFVLPRDNAPGLPPPAVPVSIVTAPETLLVELPDIILTAPLGEVPVPVALPLFKLIDAEAVVAVETSAVLTDGTWMLVP